MKTVISGLVTADTLETAEMFGITATSLITNGLDTAPPGTRLPVDVQPICPHLPGPTGVHQRNWTMLLRADALVVVGENEHLVAAAEKMGVPVFQDH